MKENQFRNKICWFTFLFSVLVIWVHSRNSELFLGKTPANVRISQLEYILGSTIAQIAVPGFFMISAYLFYRNFSWDKLWVKWNSRISSILIPFILWNVIYYLGYLIASRLPVLYDIVGRGTVPYSLADLTDAILHYTYNPVFWYLYQLILLILMAPVLYPILKNRVAAGMFLFLLAVVLWCGGSLPQLNLDALFYYSFSACAAIHGRSITESPWSRPGGLAGTLLFVSCILFYRSPVFQANLFFTILFRLAVPVALWLIVDESRLPEVRPWMKDNFFLYAVHFALVRLINKASAMILPSLPVVPLALYIAMPLLIIPISYWSGLVLKRFFPRLWLLLNGSR